MNLANKSEPVPLVTHTDGVVHVGGTRVTLDVLIAAFNEGATPEEIVSQYPTLQLADVYAVVSYYLHRRPEVEAFLNKRQQRAEEVQRQNKARFNFRGVRDRLLARRPGKQL